MKGLLYLVIAAIVLAAVAWFVHQSEESAWQQQAIPAGAELFAEFPVSEVAVVRLAGPEGTVTLRGTSGRWVVAERADYPADFGKISSLVRDMAGLTAVQSLPVADSERAALQLREPGDGVPPGEAATRLELQDASGKALADLLLGKNHMTTPAGMRPEVGGSVTGRYVLAASDPGNAYLVGEAFSGLRTTPSEWIRKDFVRPTAPRRVEVRAGDPKKSWTIERAAVGAPWTLVGAAKNESLDPGKLANIDSMLSSLTVADVPDGPQDARVQPLVEAPVTLVVDSFDGLRHTLTFGAGSGDNLPARISVETLPSPPEDQSKAREETLAAAESFRDKTVFIPRNFLDPFLQERGALLAPVPVPQPTPKPAKKKKG